MHVLRATLVATAGALLVGVDGFDPFAGPRPLAVFIQSDPWAMVYGSDTPRFALYENGEVIYLKRDGDKVVPWHAKLSEEQLAEALRRWKDLAALPDLQRDYSLSDATDEPESMFYVRDGEREVVTSVYGLATRDGGVPTTRSPGGRAQGKSPPPALIRLHKWLCTYEPEGAAPWVPSYVEVMLWDYSYAPEPSLAWPADWPDLKSERAKPRRDMWSIYLDGTQLEAVRAFLARRTPRAAIELDGRKWAIETRLVWPGEPAWRAALMRAK